jgi:hypothetical protein
MCYENNGNVMRKKDLEIRMTIEDILKSSSSGQHLKNYFATLPDKRIRRAISVLSNIYHDKTTILDEDLSFILYMFSDIKFIWQESFFAFVQAVNILSFTEHQKMLLIYEIKNNIEILCDKCTFELDTLLERLFEQNELFQYLEFLAEKRIKSVLEHVAYILRYKDFTNSCVSDGKIESLKQKISEFLTLEKDLTRKDYAFE